MPRPITGSIYKTKTEGLGIRWPENGRDERQTGFRTRTEAREWFRENVKPRLARGGPSPEITFDAFCELYLDRWGADVTPRTRRTVEEWLKPARRRFGGYTLAELEGAGADIKQWRSKLGSDDRKHKATRALRQTLAAAIRWRYLAENPAVNAGPNPASRGEEVRPFAPDEIAAILAELADSPRDMAIVTFAVETGLRTSEWPVVERRDLNRSHPPTVAVARRYAGGIATPYPKTERRAVPLTPGALDAIDRLPPRIDTPLLFPNRWGEPLNLNNWRGRVWYPALEAAGVPKRGIYHLRHTFATEALAAGVPIWQLSRVMGASVATIERHYAHHAKDSLEAIHGLLTARSRFVAASSKEAEDS